MTTVCIILAILYCGGSLAIALPYWYERGNSPCEDISSAPYGIGPVLRLWCEAAWSGLLIGAAFLVDPLLRRLEARPASTKEKKDTGGTTLPPVLLVHGLYHNPSGWLYLRRELRKADFRVIRTVSYTSWGTDIAAATATLENAVRELEQSCPGEKPLLVGHSLGGLLIRNWLAQPANQKRAAGALTLGTPHRGSKMAAVAFGALGKSLLPANPFFAELARTESPATIPCVSLVSEADTMVLPQGNLVPVTRGWSMRITPYASHVGLLVKRSVLRMAAWELVRMVREMRAAPPKPPATPESSVGVPASPTAPAPETVLPIPSPPVPGKARNKPAAIPKSVPKASAGGKKAGAGKQHKTRPPKP